MMNASTCEQAQFMVSHPGIVAVHIAMILVAIVGSSTMIGLLSAIATFRVLQINLRMLLCSLSAIILVRTLSSLGRAAYFLSLASQEDCVEVVWLLWRCQSFANIIAGPGFVTGYAFLALALERILALVLGNKYENSRVPIVGAAVTAVVWFEYLYIIVTEGAALIVNDEAKASLGYLPYCTSVSHHGLNIVQLLSTFRLIPIALISLSLFAGIFLYARRQNRFEITDQQHSLNGRFLSRVTIKTTRLVIPCAVTYYSIYIVTLIGSFVASSVSSKGNMILGTIIKELCSLAFNCFSIIFPVIMWKREPGLIFSLRNKPVDLNEPPVSAHFDVVTAMWECALPPSTRPARPSLPSRPTDNRQRKPRPLSPSNTRNLSI